MKKADIVILGAGGFGLALAVMLDKIGHNVVVWSAFQSEIDDIKRDGENKAKLPGVKVSDSITLTSDISCVSGKDIVIFGLPVNIVRTVAKQTAPYITEKTVVVNTGKGLEQGSLKRMTVVLGEELPTERIAVLSGPSHAEEVAIGMPTTVVAASESEGCADYIQSIMSSDTLRVYISDDVIGCELGGALKNIIALCAGICDGMGYGDNTKAALMTRGLVEIARLGVAMGAQDMTFAGLTGVGDLIVTCTSMHSRNRRAGILIGQGVSPEEAVKQVGTVEGYFCTKAAYELAKLKGIAMPITEQCYEVLFNGGDVRKAIPSLMGRPKKHETEKNVVFGEL
ncbi:MAG: NAD(P)H-dependent glycerol-3-phosphate dehydrogenase [Oscillospiraceae bacterium]